MKKGLTGFNLKIIGLLSMVLDHLLEFFGFLGIPTWFGWIGRIAAPVFLFESSEGFIHTSNRRKYIFRLLLGFWIMGIINMILNTYFFTGEMITNNIFSTLFLGTVYMQSLEYFQHKKFKQGITWFAMPSIVSIVPVLVTNNPE